MKKVDIFLTNSLTRKKEKFEPVRQAQGKPIKVGMYTCGPTVYDFAHIGNFRTYVTADVLARTLQFNGYQIDYVMNLTDVGHLTGDNLGDADTGEDRMEKSAKKEGKTAWEIADFYLKEFFDDFEKLNLLKPEIFAKATDHIKEQIELVQRLEEKGFTYKISDGIYFDTVEFEKKTGKKYGELSTLDSIKEGARVEPNPEKKSPRDFALWKFSQKPGERHMEWESPWGIGFPGWHIECSAMSMKYLGESFDIHIGGEDLRQTHHPNEIAQSEGATGKPFVKYWIHTTFLRVDGKRMSKSLGNYYTLKDVVGRKFDPLSLRYLYLTSYYRDTLNFTWESLSSADKALEKLRRQAATFSKEGGRTSLSLEKEDKIEKFRQEFLRVVNDDLNTPKALAIAWAMVKSNIPSLDKRDLLLSFDEVLGLDVARVPKVPRVPREVEKLIGEREELRRQEKFEEADEIRSKIEEMGYGVRDTNGGPVVKKKKLDI